MIVYLEKERRLAGHRAYTGIGVDVEVASHGLGSG